ncbi:SDR family oxidoreductase [Xylanimonas ulmi]|uniref:NADP-dependent 3-hydroxy acid dehydrogenase YdfG n=1 Tax=Xylanimonas ulmi TaxID=228973 RepID=A0A4Q7M1E2_9MICO|nr:SDR family NAD(P)-dependent oxidoreductase [Xylanibacterium ulmi]RZS60198.1 NADP-dependent 3-hydroxy acid dehydrogenase YdfG [Xylanibacterium ulmi]
MPLVQDSRLVDEPFPLRGRTAVVTGAASGIGRAVARALAHTGARVAALDVDDAGLDLVSTLDEEGAVGSVVGVRADVTDRRRLEAVRGEVRRRLGPADLVVANAGVMFGGPFELSDVGEWDQMIAVNVMGVLNTARVFVEDLLAAADKGRSTDLVIVGSVASHLLLAGFSVYSSTAAARAQLARSLRAELSDRGVRVRHIEPGTTTTGLGRGISDPRARESLERMRAVRDPLTPADVADAVVFSASLPVGVNLAEAVVLPTRQG